MLNMFFLVCFHTLKGTFIDLTVELFYVGVFYPLAVVCEYYFLIAIEALLHKILDF